jgi:hypothetical protein
MWIRGPLWDGFWILNGLPIGFLLLCLSIAIAAGPLTFSLIVLLQTGHLLSPMFLAWSHTGFRAVMRPRAAKYIGLPVLILLSTTVLGVATGMIFTDFHPDLGLSVKIYYASDYTNPFVMMLVVYTAWNAYHFAMQDFGILSIYRRKARIYGPGQRHADKIFCLVMTGAATFLSFAPHLRLDRGIMHDVYATIALLGILFMFWRETHTRAFCLPRILLIFTHAIGLVLVFSQGLWGFAIIAVNHWLVAIGLSSHVYSVNRGRSPVVFVAILIIAGMLTFALLFVSFPTVEVKVTMAAVGLRIGLGFVHFLYDRWVYKLSGAEVRETIGRDIFYLDRAHSGYRDARSGLNSKVAKVR